MPGNPRIRPTPDGDLEQVLRIALSHGWLHEGEAPEAVDPRATRVTGELFDEGPLTRPALAWSSCSGASRRPARGWQVPSQSVMGGLLWSEEPFEDLFAGDQLAASGLFKPLGHVGTKPLHS